MGCPRSPPRPVSHTGRGGHSPAPPRPAPAAPIRRFDTHRQCESAIKLIMAEGESGKRVAASRRGRRSVRERENTGPPHQHSLTQTSTTPPHKRIHLYNLVQAAAWGCHVGEQPGRPGLLPSHRGAPPASWGTSGTPRPGAATDVAMTPRRGPGAAGRGTWRGEAPAGEKVGCVSDY